MGEGRHISQQVAIEGRDVPLPMQLGTGRPTPVYGSAQPSSGVAAKLRRQAYGYPAHDPKRWVTLLAADRAERTASLAKDAVVPGRQLGLLRHFARVARAHPEGVAVYGAALLGGGLLWARRRRS